jgi:hypothetical protein
MQDKQKYSGNGEREPADRQYFRILRLRTSERRAHGAGPLIGLTTTTCIFVLYAFKLHFYLLAIKLIAIIFPNFCAHQIIARSSLRQSSQTKIEKTIF